MRSVTNLLTWLCSRAQLTGLGTAPFTAPKALFFSISASGGATAKEVLEFWGQPVIVNGKSRFLPSPTRLRPDPTLHNTSHHTLYTPHMRWHGMTRDDITSHRHTSPHITTRHHRSSHITKMHLTAPHRTT